MKQIPTLSQLLLGETGRLSNSVNLINVYIDPLLRCCSGYVGYSPSQNTIIVGHQGTDTTKMLVFKTLTIKLTAELDH